MRECQKKLWGCRDLCYGFDWCIWNMFSFREFHSLGLLKKNRKKLKKEKEKNRKKREKNVNMCDSLLSCMKRDIFLCDLCEGRSY